MDKIIIKHHFISKKTVHRNIIKELEAAVEYRVLTYLLILVFLMHYENVIKGIHLSYLS